MTLHRLRNRKNRTELARVPERPTPVSLIRAHLEAARAVGVTADELDARHVLLSYDARDREQWLAVDQLQDATYGRSTTEGDRSFESSPNNWIDSSQASSSPPCILICSKPPPRAPGKS